MNVINRIVRTILRYIAGLLCMAFGLVAAWSIIALFLPYWDLIQRGLWLGAGLIFSLLSYFMFQQLSRPTH
jgi:hypothetical protein